MRRQRPGLPPLPIRIQVAEEQCKRRSFEMRLQASIIRATTADWTAQLDALLKLLFGDAVVHLDHEPALRRRAYNPKIKNVAARYTPHAHDPDCLLYRPFAAELEGSHHIKTQVRGDNGQFPDRVLIKRERRREKKETPPPNRLIAKTWHLHPCRWCGRIHANGCPRRWPQGRKIQNQPFPSRSKKHGDRLSRASRPQKARRKEMPQARD